MKPWIETLKRQALADKKKAAAMIALVAVGLLLWGRLLLKEVPKTATAGPDAVASAAGEAIEPLPTPRSEVAVDWPDGLSRDLFAFDANRYRRTTSGNELGEQAKSPQPMTDRDLRIETVRRRARSLTLQSVVSGARPRAMINGRLMEAGQSVEGFELIEIHERSVILRMQDVRIRLGM